MRNLIFVISLIGLFLSAQAQDRSYAMPLNKISGKAYTYASTSATGDNLIPAFTSSDYVDKTDSTYSIVIYPNLDNPYEYYIALKLTRTTGTATTVVDSITLQGRIFSTESYTTIRNVKWWRSTADTTIYFDGKITGTLTGTSILDTTKIMNHASPDIKSLYYANESLVFQQAVKYRDLRIYITQQNTTGTGKSTVSGLHLKFWER